MYDVLYHYYVKDKEKSIGRYFVNDIHLKFLSFVENISLSIQYAYQFVCKDIDKNQTSINYVYLRSILTTVDFISPYQIY